MSASAGRPRVRSAAATAVLLAGMAGGPGAAAAGAAYDHHGAGYVHRLAAAALQTASAPERSPQNPNRVVVAAGHSAVDLGKRPGHEYGDCEAVGAGTRLDLRDGLLENSGPPGAGRKGGGVRNPAEAQDRWPDRSGGYFNDRRVAEFVEHVEDVPKTHGPWSADCVGDVAGRAAGHHADAVGAGAAGSATAAELDRASGVYVGVSRAFAAGLRTGAGAVDLVSAAVRIEQRGGRAPRIDYRVAVGGGVLASGTAVQAGDLPRQFADQLRRNADAVAALAALGLAVAGPTYGGDATRHVVHFPLLAVAGADGDRAVRVLTVAYESDRPVR